MRNFDVNRLVRENVKMLKPYSSARDDFKGNKNDMIFLDANENPFENGVNRYPDPQQKDLKSVLAKQSGVLVENILLGNGSDEVLDLIYRAFCEPAKDNVITLPPTYGMYKVLAETNNINNKEVLLTNDFQPDVNEILKLANQHTKLLFFCSPNNPTGNSFDNDKIESILNDFSGLVVIDEAYIDFSNKESWLSKLDKFPNLIITQTLSKAYGLAGIRLGICYASKDIITILNKIKPPYNVNELTQQRAVKRVLQPETIRKEISVILAEKKKLMNTLRKAKFVSKVYPSDANFIMVEVDNADKRCNQFITKGFVMRNRSTQPLCNNCLRITIGTPEENNKLIATLKEII
ncbi:MAG: histidinol-phosphate transaminase [Bacteroidia bacterium]|nr:histidinol-phosphate transaminase [Bacteroidia bacterium]